MTDRELLELAARAAGIKTLRSSNHAPILWDVSDEESHRIWNPLDDDGDAQRLAVKLGFCVSVYLNQNAVWVAYTAGYGRACHVELLGDDPYAATRRAIVEAAAIVGAAMAAPV